MIHDKVEAHRIGRRGHSGLNCRRIEVHATERGSFEREQVVCFLPWLLGYERCREAGLLPPDVTIAYEMPYAIVSPCPTVSIQALQVVVEDFLHLFEQRRLDPARLTLMGLSIGNFAAIYLANMLGAQVWAIAPGDRGEVLIWTSSLAVSVRRLAKARGYTYSDFKSALNELNPINNLRNIGSGSTFVAGRIDTIVPYRSAINIAAEAQRYNPQIRSIVVPLGHSGTLFAGVQSYRYMGRFAKC